MKKTLTIPDEPQPRNITRADLVMTEGFGLEVGLWPGSRWPDEDDISNAGRRSEKRIGHQNQVSHASSQGV